MYVSTNQKDWDLFLPHIVFAINASIQATTNQTPFYLIYGREAVLPLEAELSNEGNGTIVDDIIERVQEARTMAKNNIASNQQKCAKYYNEHRRVVNFELGTKVLLRKFVKKKGISSKLFHHYYRPYVIVDKIGEVNYVIEAKRNTKAYRETVHVEKLKPYYERKNGDEEIMVNKIEKEKDEIQVIPKKKVVKKKKIIPIAKPESDEQEETDDDRKRYRLRPRKSVNYKV